MITVYTKYTKTILISLLLVAMNAVAGNESKGTFSDQQGKILIEKATNNLIPIIENTKLKMFDDYANRRKTTLEALKNIKNNPTSNSIEVRYRKGKELLLDFDLEAQRIIALKPFFDGFKVASINYENVRTVERMLLHEIAHLWGADDSDAEQFANSVFGNANKNLSVLPAYPVVFIYQMEMGSLPKLYFKTDTDSFYYVLECRKDFWASVRWTGKLVLSLYPANKKRLSYFEVRSWSLNMEDKEACSKQLDYAAGSDEKTKIEFVVDDNKSEIKEIR